MDEVLKEVRDKVMLGKVRACAGRLSSSEVPSVRLQRVSKGPASEEMRE